MAKHYIRVDEKNRVIKGFSTDFEDPIDTDICINENGGRHFEILGELNPCLINTQYIYLYKYENNNVTKRTEEEIKIDIESMPKQIDTQELLAQQFAGLVIENKKKDVAIANLVKTVSELNIKIATLGGI